MKIKFFEFGPGDRNLEKLRTVNMRKYRHMAKIRTDKFTVPEL